MNSIPRDLDEVTPEMIAQAYGKPVSWVNKNLLRNQERWWKRLSRFFIVRGRYYHGDFKFDEELNILLWEAPVAGWIDADRLLTKPQDAQAWNGYYGTFLDRRKLIARCKMLQKQLNLSPDNRAKRDYYRWLDKMKRRYGPQWHPDIKVGDLKYADGRGNWIWNGYHGKGKKLAGWRPKHILKDHEFDG